MAVSDSTLIDSMREFMHSAMAGHDPSHNPAHVERVVKLSHTLLALERAAPSSSSPIAYDSTVVTLAALLHDIGDRKYLPPPDAADAATMDPTTIVYHKLLSSGATAALAERVQTIVNNVSYSTEVKDPSVVSRLIRGGYPELALVQDADRLDAIGAVGIGRCFSFLGAKGNKHDPTRWEMDTAIEHFEDKLEKLEGMMKTPSGRDLAKVRTQRLREFKSWWAEETQ